MSDITPGETNHVPIGTDVLGDTFNPTAIVNYVLLVRTPIGTITGIEAVGGPAMADGTFADGPGGAGVIGRGGNAVVGNLANYGFGAGAGVIGRGGDAAREQNQQQPPAAGVIGQAGAGGDADGVRGFGSGRFSGVAGFGDSGATANSGIGVYGQGGGPQQPAPGQPPHAGGPGVRGIGGSNEFGSDANGVEGFGSGSGAGVFGAGKGVAAPGVRGIGFGGPNTVPGDPCGVYGQAGEGTANGVEGHGSHEGAGVAGFGDPSGRGPGVVGTGRGSGAPGVKGFGAGGVDTVSISACGVYGQAGSGNSNGVEGRGNGNFAGVAGFGDVSLSAAGGIGVFAVGGAPRAASGQPGGPGVYAVGFGGPAFTPLNQTAGVYGVGGASDGPGVRGFSASGNGVYGESGDGVGVRASSGTATGLVAEGSIGLIASTTAPSGNAAQFDGNVTVSGNFTVFGKLKSVAVPFPDGSYRQLYCVESPENWFEDFGFGELSDGKARVQLDPGFRSVVNSDAYHVFITEYEDNNALFVADRTSAGFLVRAKASKANGKFGYRVVAKRKDVAPPRFPEVQLPSDRPGI
jgi:hypothetical protein